MSWKKIDKIKRKRKTSNMGIYLLFLDKNNKPLKFCFCYFFFLFLPSLENKIEMNMLFKKNLIKNNPLKSQIHTSYKNMETLISTQIDS